MQLIRLLGSGADRKGKRREKTNNVREKERERGVRGKTRHCGNRRINMAKRGGQGFAFMSVFSFTFLSSRIVQKSLTAVDRHANDRPSLCMRGWSAKFFSRRRSCHFLPSPVHSLYGGGLNRRT
jgi:hypothetical protein